jgi:hypothetical protein
MSSSLRIKGSENCSILTFVKALSRLFYLEGFIAQNKLRNGDNRIISLRVYDKAHPAIALTNQQASLIPKT